MTEKKKYDSTVAQIAGTLLSSEKELFYEKDTARLGYKFDGELVKAAVAAARAIVAEVVRTEPETGGEGA